MLLYYMYNVGVLVASKPLILVWHTLVYAPISAKTNQSLTRTSRLKHASVAI